MLTFIDEGDPMSGIDFLALQVDDLEESAAFLSTHLGWTRTDVPPGAVVFDTEPIPVAVREPTEDLDGGSRPGLGMWPWIRVEDTDALRVRLDAAGVTIVDEPYDSPFGRAMTSEGPQGYLLTVHDQ